MSDSEKYITVLEGDQLAVAAKEVSGSIISEPSTRYITTLVQTDEGVQLAVKAYVLNDGGGGGGDVDYTKIVQKTSNMPTASSSNAGYVYMYQGTTNQTYTHGYIYENQYAANYAGTIAFTPAGISVSDEDFSSFLNTWKQYLTTPTLVTNGTITYYADANLWRMIMKDANNQQIGTLQLYQEDYEDSGFTFPADPQDGDEYTFTTTITESSSSYQWVRIDVQPSSGGGSSDYTDLSNKPSINSVTLSGNKTSNDLGVANVDLSNLTSEAKPNIIDTLSDIYNTVQYSVVGSPTFNGGVVSGFSAADYLTLTKNPTIGAGDDFEISVCFVTPSTKYGHICGWYTNTNGGIMYLDYNALGVTITSSVELKLFGLMLDGEKKYTAKLVRNNGVITFSVYEAGALLQQTQTEFNGAIEFSSFVFITFGNDYVSNYWTGSIDLTETYIKVNDKMWFIGRSQEVNPAHLAMPSDVYDNLTLTSGTIYTAPADGYVGISLSSGNFLHIILLLPNAPSDDLQYRLMELVIGPSNGYPRGFIPISKGQKFCVDFLNGTMIYAHFVYAQGTKHEKQGA